MALRATPEKKEEKARTRVALLRAALQLGATHGFSSIGLREVARAAGIAPTSFYRHFADMEELGLALAEELAGAWLRRFRAGGGHAAGALTRDAVLALIDAVLESAAADPELTRFVLAELAGCSPSLRAALAARVAELADTLSALFARGESEERLPHALTEAAVVLLLDGCRRDLEGGADQRGRLREGLALALHRLLASCESRSAP